MGCKNCGNGSRHKTKEMPLYKGERREAVMTNEGPKYMSVSEDGKEPPATLRSQESPMAMPTPQEAFDAAKSLSYEEIVQMTHSQQEMMDKSSLDAMASMTVAMKRYHITSLLSVANYDNTTMTGVSPTQALVAIHKALNLDEFKCINDLYPNLLKDVSIKVDKLMQDRIIID